MKLTACMLSLLSVTSASAITMTRPIQGTCGFYSGTPSNVVYSENFTGDGTFCTGFMAGGSFTNNGQLEAGDIFASSTNDITAFAPTGFGVFVNFSQTFSVTQEYLVIPTIAPSTATGSIKTFLQAFSIIDDGTGSTSCHEMASIDLAGVTSSQSTPQFTIPITFGQPISAVETASISCVGDHSVISHAFGDSGSRAESAGPIVAYDANGNLLGTAILVTVPEPALALPLVLVLGFLCIAARRFAASSAAVTPKRLYHPAR